MTTPRLPRLLAALALASLVSAAPLAAAPSLANLTAEQMQTVQAVNAYFNSMTTLEGKFVQTGPDGSQTTGYFVIDRPGKMRFRYYPPAQLDIIADGKTVAIDDKAIEDQTLLLLSETPLRFLLQKNMDLTREAAVSAVAADEDLITIVLEDSAVYSAGRLTLIFDARSTELKQWTVTDSQGLDTTVAVYEVKTDTQTNPEWFKINYSKYR
ncbi:MAG TPA: outer membrane lipoprotein carrier protein LolA [Methylomirabilota bacterium]|nr:outer membrane lipoprotein carrier protein LolA [Methylomirabilota bacterium]